MMADLQSFSIELTQDLADLLRRKVASGRYASESEAVSEALLSLEGFERPLEDWLQDVVLPRAAEDDADPGDTLTLEEVKASLAVKPALNATRG